jgi:hypothetical protein
MAKEADGNQGTTAVCRRFKSSCPFFANLLDHTASRNALLLPFRTVIILARGRT